MTHRVYFSAIVAGFGCMLKRSFAFIPSLSFAFAVGFHYIPTSARYLYLTIHRRCQCITRAIVEWSDEKAEENYTCISTLVFGWLLPIRAHFVDSLRNSSGLFARTFSILMHRCCRKAIFFSPKDTTIPLQCEHFKRKLMHNKKRRRRTRAWKKLQ